MLFTFSYGTFLYDHILTRLTTNLISCRLYKIYNIFMYIVINYKCISSKKFFFYVTLHKAIKKMCLF